MLALLVVLAVGIFVGISEGTSPSRARLTALISGYFHHTHCRESHQNQETRTWLHEDL